MEKKKKDFYGRKSTIERKIICMLAFCGFMTGFFFTVLALIRFGDGIYKNENFFSSYACQNALQHDIFTLIYNLESVQELNGVEDSFSIYDVGTGTLNTYDNEALDSKFFSGDSNYKRLSLLDKWKIKEAQMPYNMADIRSARLFLNSVSARNCYLYFSKESFVNLFGEKGSVKSDTPFYF